MKQFKPGDPVTFTRSTRTGTSIEHTVAEAVIEAELPEEPGVYRCRIRNGRKYEVHASRLRHASQMTEIEEAIQSGDGLPLNHDLSTSL